MGMITLQNPSCSEITILSNSFIDNYMPEANGEFVKVYVYLLRTLSNAPVSFSLEQMADRLLCTERDILRALKYWAKMNLLSLNYTSGKKLCGIVLLSPDGKSRPAEETAASVQEIPESAGQDSPAEEKSSIDHPIEKTVSLTPDRVKELKQNEDIVQLLYIAEQYLGKTLSATEMQKILFFYDGLHFSADLIEYLIEYCVSRNHKSMRYIETVALAWAKEGISTVQMAKDTTSRYGRDYFTILKSLGITGRNPVETEISLMDVWMKDYGFSMEIIQEACSRTILQTGQPSFQYADKILAGWKKKNVRHLEDILVLDAEHKKRKKEKAGSRQTSSSPNRFNNFHQREYDFDEYEKRLLNQ